MSDHIVECRNSEELRLVVQHITTKLFIWSVSAYGVEKVLSDTAVLSWTSQANCRAPSSVRSSHERSLYFLVLLLFSCEGRTNPSRTFWQEVFSVGSLRTFQKIFRRSPQNGLVKVKRLPKRKKYFGIAF
jgi:hypothetical protein